MVAKHALNTLVYSIKIYVQGQKSKPSSILQPMLFAARMFPCLGQQKKQETALELSKKRRAQDFTAVAGD